MVCSVFPSSRSVVWSFFIPLNDLVYEMAREGVALKGYRWLLKIFFPSSGGVVDFKNSVDQCVNQANLILETSKTKEICRSPV